MLLVYQWYEEGLSGTIETRDSKGARRGDNLLLASFRRLKLQSCRSGEELNWNIRTNRKNIEMYSEMQRVGLMYKKTNGFGDISLE